MPFVGLSNIYSFHFSSSTNHADFIYLLYCTVYYVDILSATCKVARHKRKKIWNTSRGWAKIVNTRMPKVGFYWSKHLDSKMDDQSSKTSTYTQLRCLPPNHCPLNKVSWSNFEISYPMLLYLKAERLKSSNHVSVL